MLLNTMELMLSPLVDTRRIAERIDVSQVQRCRGPEGTTSKDADIDVSTCFCLLSLDKDEQYLAFADRYHEDVLPKRSSNFLQRDSDLKHSKDVHSKELFQIFQQIQGSDRQQR